MSCAWWTDQGRLCFNEAPEKPNFPWPDDPRISLCGPHKAKAKKWFVPPQMPGIRYEEWWMYIILNRHLNQIKIGRSTMPEKRIRDLETQAGTRYAILLVAPETATLSEGLGHEVAGEYRRLGEWFEASPAVLDWVWELRRFVADELQLREELSA